MPVKRILCYGDSLTWGYIPGSGERFDENIRWPRAAAKILGDEYEILEDGISGRTIACDTGRNPYQNGLKGLGYALLAHSPLDMVAVMLGTNDLEFRTAASTAVGMDELVRRIQNANTIYRCSSPIFKNRPRVLIISPPLPDERIDTLFPFNSIPGKAPEYRKLAACYQNVAESRGADFLNAALFAEADPADCIHIAAESQVRLGRAVAAKIQEIYGAEPSEK